MFKVFHIFHELFAHLSDATNATNCVVLQHLKNYKFSQMILRIAIKSSLSSHGHQGSVHLLSICVVFSWPEAPSLLSSEDVNWDLIPSKPSKALPNYCTFISQKLFFQSI